MTNNPANQPASPTYIGAVSLGVLFALWIMFWPYESDLPNSARKLAGVTALMAMLWMSQAIPLAATGLIPLALFPLLGIQTSAVVSKAYINQYIFLFLGGFIIALGIENCGLHRRIAMMIVDAIGVSARRVVLGFMLATAALSMWISNTATTLMMMPIGLAMITTLRETVVSLHSGDEGKRSQQIDQLGTALMLGIAYAANIGGFTTLVGTPPNIAFVAFWNKTYPNAPDISTGEWITAFLPIGILMLLCTWLLLCWGQPRKSESDDDIRKFFSQRLKELGQPSRAECLMFTVFFTTAILWITRKPVQIASWTVLRGWGGLMATWLEWLGATAEFASKAVDDSTVAIGMAILLFCLPAGRQDDRSLKFLMDWESTQRLPWGILLFFGSGLALAGGFEQTGLSDWIGQNLIIWIEHWPLWLIIFGVCIMLTFLTELGSNLATINIFLPILAALCVKLKMDPRLILIPATISASCAFMLPIATPPNAIVFGSNQIKMGQMMRYGLLLNFAGAIIVMLGTLILLAPIWGVQLEAVLKPVVVSTTPGL